MTPRRRKLHRRIREQAEALRMREGFWRRSEFPELARLLDAVTREARSRKRKKSRIAVNYEGKRYIARFTNLGRVIVETTSGYRIAAGPAFAL